MSEHFHSEPFQYGTEPDLSAAEFIGILEQSGLSKRRPIDDKARVARMLEGADLIVTARDKNGQLVGVARTISDFSYCSYLSDLAVARDFQGQGIGQRLMRETLALVGPQSMLLLISAPDAVSYYQHLVQSSGQGLNIQVVERAFMFGRQK